MANVIVAGGSSGIGQASVLAFSARGDNVVLADHNLAGAQATATAASGDVHVVHADLTDPTQPAAIVSEAVRLFSILDAVFITAAVMTARPLAQWSVELWDQSVALNLRMPFLFAQAAAPYLQQSSIASLLFTSSTAALRGHAGMPAYHATKSGLDGLCRSLADELGPLGIRVNTILPGWIDTPFNNAFWDHQESGAASRQALEQRIPLRRQGLPSEVADMVMFLCSPGSRYVTGSSIVIDGGYTVI